MKLRKRVGLINLFSESLCFSNLSLSELTEDILAALRFLVFLFLTVPFCAHAPLIGDVSLELLTIDIRYKNLQLRPIIAAIAPIVPSLAVFVRLLLVYETRAVRKAFGELALFAQNTSAIIQLQIRADLACNIGASILRAPHRNGPLQTILWHLCESLYLKIVENGGTAGEFERDHW